MRICLYVHKHRTKKNKKIFWFFLDKKISINYHNHADEKNGDKKMKTLFKLIETLTHNPQFKKRNDIRKDYFSLRDLATKLNAANFPISNKAINSLATSHTGKGYNLGDISEIEGKIFLGAKEQKDFIKTNKATSDFRNIQIKAIGYYSQPSKGQDTDSDFIMIINLKKRTIFKAKPEIVKWRESGKRYPVQEWEEREIRLKW